MLGKFPSRKNFINYYKNIENYRKIVKILKLSEGGGEGGMPNW
jgi:hypothetical protein